MTGDLAAVHPGRATSTTARFGPATGGYTNVVSIIDPRANVAVDPETLSPNTDHFTVGVDREIGKNMSIGATYFYKQGRDFLGWTDVGGVYGTETVALADGSAWRCFRFSTRRASGNSSLRTPRSTISATGVCS